MTIPRAEIERILALAEKATLHRIIWVRTDDGKEHSLYANQLKQLCEAAILNTAQAQVTEAEVEAAAKILNSELSSTCEGDCVCWLGDYDVQKALEAAARARGTGEERG